jgi:hypothetical protein
MPDFLDLESMFEIHEVRSFKDDPTKSGRVKTRAYNRQNDEQSIPDDDLPWAAVLQPAQSAATSKLGLSPHGLKVGSRVLTMYMPWDVAKQYPIVLGSLPRGDMPEGHEDDNGGVSSRVEDAQKNSGGKIKHKGVDNPAHNPKEE